MGVSPSRGRAGGRGRSPTFGTGRTWIQTWTWNASRLPWRPEGGGAGAKLHNLIYCRVGGRGGDLQGSFSGRGGGALFLTASEIYALGWWGEGSWARLLSWRNHPNCAKAHPPPPAPRAASPGGTEVALLSLGVRPGQAPADSWPWGGEPGPLASSASLGVAGGRGGGAFWAGGRG